MKNTSMIEKFPLTEEDKKCLAEAYRILKDSLDDMYAEDMEDTDDYFKAEEACEGLRKFLSFMDIDYMIEGKR